MGCLFSKSEQVRTLSNDDDEPLPASAFSGRGAAHAWLQEIGLPQYTRAFETAGFSDWDLLSCLTEADLEAITSHTGTVIAPGHRKKLLMASRQMGQTSAGMASLAPLFGSARRYSHTSNPGNGHSSRGGGLGAAAAAALERRSGGRRPSGMASRVPSHHSHYGTPGHNSHPSHHYHASQHSANAHSRHATEDGMTAARPARPRPPIAVLLASSINSSRNSLLNGGGGGGGGGGVGHAIGYIASPSATLAGTLADGVGGANGEDRFPRSGASVTTVAAGDGGSDVWPALDGRPSPAEPPSPQPAAAALAAAAAAVAGGSPAPPRPRKRWSVNQQASRGALINGNGNGNGYANGNGNGGVAVVASGSSVGWLDPEVLASGVGPVSQQDVDGGGNGSGVRPPSVTAAADGSVKPARRVTPRDLQALVVGANDHQNQHLRNNGSRGQHSLAAARPAERPHPGNGGAAGDFVRVVPMSPPRFGGGYGGAAAGGFNVAAGGGPAAAEATQVQSRPVSRMSTPRSALTAGLAAGVGPGTPSRPRGLTVSVTPSADGNEPPSSPPPPHPYPLGAVVATASAGLTPPGGGGGAGHSRRGGGAADITLPAWAMGPASPPPPSREPSHKSRTGAAAAAHTPPSGGGAAAADGAAGGGAAARGSDASSLAPTPPGAAWALQPDTPPSTAVIARTHEDAAPAASRNSAASGGGALPRFVRAIAGWAVPGGAAAAAAAAPVAASAAGGGGGRRHSGEHHQPQQQRRSTVADLRPQQLQQADAMAAAGAAAAQPAGRWPRSAGPGSSAARRVRLEGGSGPGWHGDGERCSPTGSSVPRVAVEAAAGLGSGGGGGVTVAASALRGRSSRYMLIPDPAPRGPWDQNTALCIQGRGYRPAPSSADASRAASRGGASPSDADTGSGAASVAATAAAARGGGWPFVLPQLPAGRISNNGGTGAPVVVPGPAGAAAGVVAGAGHAARPQPQTSGGGGGEPPPHPISPVAPASSAVGAAAAAAAAATPFSRLSPPLEIASSRGDIRTSNASMLLDTMTAASDATSATTATTARRAPPLHSSRPPGCRPSIGDSASGEATGGGDGTAGGGGGTDMELMSDDLAPALSGLPSARPHRVQIVHVEPSSPMPYDAASNGQVWGRGGGGGAGAGVNGSTGGGITAAGQWPAMPLQPPTRAKPYPSVPSTPTSATAAAAAAITGTAAGGSVHPNAGAYAAMRVGLMELLPPEMPRPGRAPQAAATQGGDDVPPGSAGDAAAPRGAAAIAAAGGGAPLGPPLPTPGRQLDLETLADQVSRIMTHLSHITGGEEEQASTGGDVAGGASGRSADADMGVAECAAGGAAAGTPAHGRRALRGPSNTDGGGPLDGSHGRAAMALAGASSASGALGGGSSRMEAMDLKRQELRELHLDLVTRVAALASQPPAAQPQHHGPPQRAASADSAAAAANANATEALAEVEARIRAKLTELAALTVPAPTDVSAHGTAAAAAAAAVGDNGSAARKRSLYESGGGDEAAGRPLRGQPRQDEGPGGPARRFAEEAALHEEVLAVLGARKRKAHAGRLSSGSGSSVDAEAGQAAGPTPGVVEAHAVIGTAAAARAAPAGSAAAGGSALMILGRRPQSPLGLQQQQRAPSSRQPSPLRRRAGAGPEVPMNGGGADAAEGGGPVLAEMHDALRAELLAIENKIRSRVREGGGAVVSRRA